MANAGDGTLAEDSRRMSSDLIVSYDGTPNDDDALALGRLLARTGASLSLAYIRHSHEFDPAREELAQHDAVRRLEQGAAWLQEPDIPKYVVFSGSTEAGLEQLAEAEQAAAIVFGSDYRTPPGRAEPGTSADRLLGGGSVAIAVAAAGLRTVGRRGDRLNCRGAGRRQRSRTDRRGIGGEPGSEQGGAGQRARRSDRGRFSAGCPSSKNHAERRDPDVAEQRVAWFGARGAGGRRLEPVAPVFWHLSNPNAASPPGLRHTSARG